MEKYLWLKRVAAILIFALSMVSLPSHAQDNSADRKSSSQQAAKKAKKQYGGKVLDVKNDRKKGNSNYKVKLLKPNGRIISVNVDGKNNKKSSNKKKSSN